MTKRPLKCYGQNVARLLNGLPYHDKRNPNGLREIHCALAIAHDEGRKLTTFNRRVQEMLWSL